MKRTHIRHRLLSLVLALTLLTSMAGMAHATSDGKCPCGATYNRTVLHQANCHEYGVVEYSCPTPGCTLTPAPILVKTAMDPNYHNAVYSDNKDGATHTATCLYHTNYRNVSEAHTFVNGYCIKCAAADYSLATFAMSESIDAYVSLNDLNASVSVGDVALKVGTTDVTDSYTISYSWVDQSGVTVGTGKTYTLPAAITATEGDYTYGCFVMAMPKSGTTGKYISESCTVTVHVRQLVLASATLNADAAALKLSATNSRTPVSILQQIYQAAYKLSTGVPSYVIFGTRSSTEPGVLSAGTGAYYFNPTTGQQSLGDVTFTPVPTASGTCTINFTVYDAAGKDFPGVLTVNVERDLGSPDISYVAAPGSAVTMRTSDFNAFWQKTYSKGAVTMMSFTSLPAVTEGAIYYNYLPGSLNTQKVTTSDVFYGTYSSATQTLIDGLTFVPTAGFTGHVKVPFEVYGLTDAGTYAFQSGEISFFISAGTVRSVTCSGTTGTPLKFSAADFLAVHQAATGSTSNFSIKLLDAPVNGSLYAKYTGTVQDTPIAAAAVSDHTFHYSSVVGSLISDLTYVCPKSTTAKSETLRYVACDSKGNFLYTGTISITCKSAVVVYTKNFTDVPKTSSTEWFYTAVMDLAEAGVINGMTDTTFDPNGEVTYGQALKLILLAAGYTTPAQTGKHWASGFLSVAQADGLVSLALTEAHLDRKIARNDIAQIAAKALKLPASQLTASPFADVVHGSVYSPYIYSLYDAGIITGAVNSKGQTVYYGVNSIRRNEMAVIVWRINNYNG